MEEQALSGWASMNEFQTDTHLADPLRETATIRKKENEEATTETTERENTRLHF